MVGRGTGGTRLRVADRGSLKAVLPQGSARLHDLPEQSWNGHPQPVRPLDSLLKRHLIRQLVDEEVEAGRFNHFGPIAATSGLLDLLCDFIRQMKRLEIWPEQFAEACLFVVLRRRIVSCWPSIGPISRDCWTTICMMPRAVSGRPAICSSDGHWSIN